MYFHAVHGSFYTTLAELRDCNRDHGAFKVKSISHLALYRKRLLTPELNMTFSASLAARWDHVASHGRFDLWAVVC